MSVEEEAKEKDAASFFDRRRLFASERLVTYDDNLNDRLIVLAGADESVRARIWVVFILVISEIETSISDSRRARRSKRQTSSQIVGEEKCEDSVI